MPKIPGYLNTNKLYSLSALAPFSGNYVSPINWRKGIQGLGLGAVPTLTPGMHGLMMFPGSGGSDVLVRNPIHPSNANAIYIGQAQLGRGNKVNEGGSPATSATDPAGFTALTDDALAHILGLSGLGCDCGGGCGSDAEQGCNGGCPAGGCESCGYESAGPGTMIQMAQAQQQQQDLTGIAFAGLLLIGAVLLLGDGGGDAYA
jgi:hypothetical protein